MDGNAARQQTRPASDGLSRRVVDAVSHRIALRSTTLHYMTLPYVASSRFASRHSTSRLPCPACLVPLAWQTRHRLPTKADFQVF